MLHSRPRAGQSHASTVSQNVQSQAQTLQDANPSGPLRRLDIDTVAGLSRDPNLAILLGKLPTDIGHAGMDRHWYVLERWLGGRRQRQADL